jgi:DoxX-like family
LKLLSISCLLVRLINKEDESMVKKVRTGQVISGLVVLFMVFDGVIHVMRVASVVDALAQLGYPLRVAVPLGILELFIAILYAIPGTAVIGAMLLTAYLGGATATQVRIGADPFPILFPALVGALLWGGLYLRDARVRALLAAKGKVTC